MSCFFGAINHLRPASCGHLLLVRSYFTVYRTLWVITGNNDTIENALAKPSLPIFTRGGTLDAVLIKASYLNFINDKGKEQNTGWTLVENHLPTVWLRRTAPSATRRQPLYYNTSYFGDGKLEDAVFWASKAFYCLHSWGTKENWKTGCSDTFLHRNVVSEQVGGTDISRTQIYLFKAAMAALLLTSKQCAVPGKWLLQNLPNWVCQQGILFLFESQPADYSLQGRVQVFCFLPKR